MSVLLRVNSEVLEYIKEIANKMKNNRAAVMVGAGFSKNAEAILQTEKRFLDWNGLGNVFYEKTHGKLPGDDAKYLNVLKLAEEVEAAYGRTVLNQLIKDNLPDLEYAPSILHEKLLRLDWKDVFTTNYDTLLERTLERITEKHYDVILNKQDLIYSSEPRIIKLHGSFPSTFPFVITEEDYRQYPKKSAIFVNTVQQSLIENVLCLVGFSGDDPNFLQWIGWIRDNIGKDLASKIYLVGVFNYSTAQINLLQNKNIIILNMGNSKGVDGDFYSGLELFFDSLAELTEKEDVTKWPSKGNYRIVTFDEKDISDKVTGIVKEWEESRKNYPGWYITPSDNRTLLKLRTEHCERVLFYIKNGNVEAKIAFDFLYEYNWCINKCLMPIEKSDICIYEKVLSSTNPFVNIFKITDNDIEYCKTNKDWKDVCQKWIDIYLDMMRAYRENGVFSKFDIALANISSGDVSLTPEQEAKMHCEKVRKLLFQLNIKEAKKSLNEWPKNVSLPAYEMKKAGLFMELGDVSQALKILLEELNYVRKGTNKEINLFKTTIEAYLVLLASYAHHSLNIEECEKEETEIKFTGDFNAYAEIRLFEALLKEEAAKEYKKEEYDLNRITRTITSINTSYEEAFQFVRFFEEIGSPYNCNHVVSAKSACSEAIRRINPIAPLWSLILQIKNNDKNIDDKIWSREVIFKMTNEEIEKYSNLCISAIKNNLEYIENGNNWCESNFQLGIASIIPDILSRLCSRMSEELQLKTLDVLDGIYRSKKPENFKNIKYLAKRLISSMSEKTKIENFGTLMKTYLYEPSSIADKLEFADIFDSFSYKVSNQDKYKTVNLDEHLTEILLQLLDRESGRDIALTRLVYLYDFGLMSEEDIKAFERNIWSKLDASGLPQIPNKYLKNYILNLPTPEGVDSRELLKKYILNLPFPKEAKGITVFSAYDMPLLLLELKYCTFSLDNTKGIKWNTEEINSIIGKILDAWENDKSILLSYDETNPSRENLYEELLKKYSSLDSILAKVLISNGFDINVNESVKTLYKELESFDIPCTQLRILLNDGANIFDEIYTDICGTNNDRIVAACNAIYTLMSLMKTEFNEPCIDLLKKVSVNIRIRRKQGLTSIIYLMHNLIYSNIMPNDSEIMDNILFGLTCLFEDTKLLNNNLDYSVNQCISLRAAAAELAYILYKKNEGNVDICSKLVQWKEISNDLTEFAEVRNKWSEL